MKILSVAFHTEPDNDPDLSFIGEYTERSDPWVIVRSEGEYLANLPDDRAHVRNRREYSYFKPYAGGETPGTLDYQTTGKLDYARMEAYDRGEWSMLYCYASASVEIGGTIQTIRSGGIGNVESDSDESEFRDEEMTALRAILEEMGFSKRAVARAFKGASK